jgi:hypothetical protein
VQVHVHPVTPDRLPQSAGAILFIDRDDIHLYYAHVMPLHERCAYADLALTAGFNELITRLTRAT